MSAQPLTFENVLELISKSSREFSRSLKEQGAEFDRLMKNQAVEFRQEMKERAAEFDKTRQETDRRMQKTEQQMQKTDRRIKRTSEEVGKITGSMGRVIEHMVAGDNIIGKFQAIDYEIESFSRNKKFGRSLPKELDAVGEIDLFLENGEIAILIEVKTTLQMKDVNKLMRTLEKFRRRADYKGDNRRFIGAVAGAVVEDEAMNFALDNGIYVIVQSGEAVNIVPTPEGFKARKW